MVTARASRELADLVGQHVDRGLVTRLCAWEGSSTDAAVGTSLKKAGDVAQALRQIDWQVLDMATALKGEQQQQAERLAVDLTTSLESDEHVIALGPKLVELKRSALQLMETALAQQEPPEPVVPDSENDVTPDTIDVDVPTPGRSPVAGQADVSLDALPSVMTDIQSKAKEFKKPKVQISWRIHE